MVDLPAPGGPAMPMRVLPVVGSPQRVGPPQRVGLFEWVGRARRVEPVETGWGGEVSTSSTR